MIRPLAEPILVSAAQLEQRVAQLAQEIGETVPADGELAVLVVLKGAFVFAADLVRRLPCRTRIGFLEIHKQPDRPGRADFVFTHPFSVEGSDLLVVEDILDTGYTLDHLLARLRTRRPARLRTVVLLDKKPRRQVAIEPDWIGFEIPDQWVVGYGLDDDEYYRNLPDIRYV